MNIKAILYDLGDIFFEAHYWRLWNFNELKVNNCFNGTFLEFYTLYESFLSPVYSGQMEYMNAFQNMLIHLNVPDKDQFCKISFEKKKYFESSRSLFPGVSETLEKIFNRGIKNVIVTDNELNAEEIKKNILARYGIVPFLTEIVSSKTMGTSKNESAIFFEALNLFKLNSDEAIFVGHDKEELISAQNAGIKTVLFNNYLEDKIESTFQINSFPELLEIIQ